MYMIIVWYSYDIYNMFIEWLYDIYMVFICLEWDSKFEKDGMILGWNPKQKSCFWRSCWWLESLYRQNTFPMPWCHAIQRFTHDFDVDFPVPSKSYCQRRNEFMPSRNVCPMQTCSPRWGWIPLEDTWQLGWHQAAPSRLLEKSQPKIINVRQNLSGSSVVLTNIGIISQARATHGKVALSAISGHIFTGRWSSRWRN